MRHKLDVMHIEKCDNIFVTLLNIHDKIDNHVNVEPNLHVGSTNMQRSVFIIRW